MKKRNAQLTLTIIAGALIGSSLTLLANKSPQPNTDFQTQSISAEQKLLHTCSQTITYQDDTQREKSFFAQADQSFFRECTQKDQCSDIENIQTDCIEL